MVTLLRVRMADGRWKQCDARCHNAGYRECDCPCGGRFHGKQEGTPVFLLAVRDHLQEILADLGLHEQAGELWIAGYRPRLGEAWVRRPRWGRRYYLGTLFDP